MGRGWEGGWDGVGCGPGWGWAAGNGMGEVGWARWDGMGWAHQVPGDPRAGVRVPLQHDVEERMHVRAGGVVALAIAHIGA